MTLLESTTVRAKPAQLLQFSKRVESPKPFNELINLVQLRVKAKLDKIKEVLEWQEYVNNHIQSESEGQVLVNTELINSVVSAEKNDSSISKIPARLEKQRITVKTPSVSHVYSRISNPDKSFRGERRHNDSIPSIDQPFKKEKLQKETSRLVNNPVSYKQLRGKAYEENIGNLTKTLASKQDISKLSKTLPSKDDIQRLARILLSKEIVRYHSRRLPPSTFGVVKLQRTKTDQQLQRSTPSVPRRPTSTSSSVRTRPNDKVNLAKPQVHKNTRLKNVRFLDRNKMPTENADAGLKKEAVSQNEEIKNVDSLSYSEIERQQKIEKEISEQLNELQNVHLQLAKMQEQEMGIRRKWNHLHSSAFPENIPNKLVAVIHEPLTRAHFGSKDVTDARTRDKAKRKEKIPILERIADSLLDDAVRQVAKELTQISEECVSTMYEEEFCTSPSFSRTFL